MKLNKIKFYNFFQLLLEHPYYYMYFLKRSVKLGKINLAKLGCKNPNYQMAAKSDFSITVGAIPWSSVILQARYESLA